MRTMAYRLTCTAGRHDGDVGSEFSWPLPEDLGHCLASGHIDLQDALPDRHLGTRVRVPLSRTGHDRADSEDRPSGRLARKSRSTRHRVARLKRNLQATSTGDGRTRAGGGRARRASADLRGRTRGRPRQPGWPTVIVGPGSRPPAERFGSTLPGCGCANRPWVATSSRSTSGHRTRSVTDLKPLSPQATFSILPEGTGRPSARRLWARPAASVSLR